MIMIIDQTTFPHDQVVLDKERLELKLRKTGYLYGKLDQSHIGIDLKQLSNITLVYEFPDYQARKMQAEARLRAEKARRSSDATDNLIIGGMLGGMLDAAHGDDGIIDGVIAGAALGYMASDTSEPRLGAISMKEKSKQQAVLAFKDGTAITCKLDATGMADLIAVAHIVATRCGGQEVTDPVFKIPLSQEELKTARKYNADKQIEKQGVWQRKASDFFAHLAAITLMLVLFWTAMSFTLDRDFGPLGWNGVAFLVGTAALSLFLYVRAETVIEQYLKQNPQLAKDASRTVEIV